ncbi:MAG: NAD(P)H-dependent glycerol-3-phosphate dehydrogenase [Gammaproteobacteria bacterium]|nr:NAD(P)H-dependent glycerol-3-phosphate dehydrogenase [Gammaproteobacteria bacterium]
MTSNKSSTLFPTVVIGAGAWGTALAMAIARNGHEVVLWARDVEHVNEMQASRSNERYLPNLSFPESLSVSADFDQALTQAQHVLVSVPSTAFVDILKQMKPVIGRNLAISWATKGLTADTGKFLLDTAQEILGGSHPFAIISGPSFASEVAKNLPTAITIGSLDEAFAEALASAMHSPTLRAYTTTDVLGVQLGGTVKNVMAIAAGIADGLGYGANTRAALITRGMAEILRLATHLGAKTETLFGLSGIGDLILTCTDDQSRNRQLGLLIGQGLSVEQAVEKLGKTVEGMTAAREVMMRAKQVGIEMPIVQQVYKVLFEGYDPHQAVKELLERDQKAEAYTRDY